MIISQLTGGLGNQLFQYAFGRYLAIRNNTTLKLDTSSLVNRVPSDLTFYNYELGDFNLQAGIADNNDISLYPADKSVKSVPFRIWHIIKLKLKGYRYIREWTFGFKEKYLSLPDNTYLDGYWQSQNFFGGIAGQLKQDFKFTTDLQPIALAMAKQIESYNAISVHVRRGDYLKHLQHHGVVGSDYIEKAERIILEKVANPVFFVFSNDPEWCKENLKFKSSAIIIDEANAGTNDKDHFRLMSKCKHFIIANSSFSWWAAWLGEYPNKIVIAPEKWLNNSKVNTDYIIPEEWIKI
jgi:hypothetical protein